MKSRLRVYTNMFQDGHGTLVIVDTHDAANPMRDGMKPLMTCDVWEHAYYLDYQNNRAGYVESFWSLVNWEFVSKNYRYVLYTL